jgi:hypothetical protein
MGKNIFMRESGCLSRCSTASRRIGTAQRDVKDLSVIYEAVKKLANGNFFPGNIRFEYEGVVVIKAAAPAAIRHRKDLENHVDLTAHKIGS